MTEANMSQPGTVSLLFLLVFNSFFQCLLETVCNFSIYVFIFFYDAWKRNYHSD